MSYLSILLEKEIKQILKDKSVFVLVFILPVVLVIIYGSAIRMEVKPVSLCIASYNQSLIERTIAQEFLGSTSFKVSMVNSFAEGKALLDSDQVKSLLYIPKDFTSKLLQGHGELVIYLNGTEAQLASISDSYIKLSLQNAMSKLYPDDSKRISIITRNWFNEANESVWFLMSGQYVSIISLMSIFLGCFVIAREWDRKTIESLAATNASALQIVSAKVIIYYVLSLWAVFIILALGELLYKIPIRGNILALIASLSIYALEMICLGVLISAKLKSQFTAAQCAVIIGFLPTVMLSGLLFDLRAVEPFIAFIGKIIPPTYEVKAMRINMLSGGNGAYIWQNFAIQLAWCALFFTLAVRQVKRDSK